MPRKHPTHPLLDLHKERPDTTGKRRETVVLRKASLRVTPVFYAYWRFAAERQEIFFRRLARKTEALTTDPILKQFKFTNAYRASDRVSQYLIRNVVYRPDLPNDATNLFFRIILFKLFNKIETWKYLEEETGGIAWETFSFERYSSLLSRRMSAGHRIYSAAYIMPSGGSFFGYKVKHQNNLRMMEMLIRERFPSRLSDCKTMAEVFRLLRSVPSIGSFLAYQYATDLNYSPLTSFGEDEFVVAGPGALDGIHKCFEGAHPDLAEDVIHYMWEHQEKHFSDLGIKFQNLWGRRLQLIDCQNVFCEISKYARVAFPDYEGVAGRTRIKQKFAPNGSLPKPWYPPKWNINDQIATALP
jgi:5-hmdU DNA kinase, helical domain